MIKKSRNDKNNLYINDKNLILFYFSMTACFATTVQDLKAITFHKIIAFHIKQFRIQIIKHLNLHKINTRRYYFTFSKNVNYLSK